jgi:hypothetical protein
MVGRRNYNSPDCPVYIGSSGVPAARLPNGRPRDQRAPRVPGQWSLGCTRLSGAPPDCPVCHGARGLVTVGFAKQEKESHIIHCPVCPQTYGNQSLPNGGATTSLALGAIKGAPRRLYQDTKHPLNIFEL